MKYEALSLSFGTILLQWKSLIAWVEQHAIDFN